MSISTRTTAALLVLGALIAGVVLGVAGDRAYLWHWHRLMPSSRMEGFMTRRVVEHLDNELHFTPQQRTAVQQIIDRHRARIDALSTSVRPQIRQELEAANAEIETVLDPQQKARYRQMALRMMQRHRGRMR